MIYAWGGPVEVATQIFKAAGVSGVGGCVYVTASIMDVSEQLAEYAASK